MWNNWKGIAYLHKNVFFDDEALFVGIASLRAFQKSIYFHAFEPQIIVLM